MGQLRGWQGDQEPSVNKGGSRILRHPTEEQWVLGESRSLRVTFPLLSLAWPSPLLTGCPAQALPIQATLEVC